MSKLFDDRDRDHLEWLGAIATCNPFSPERKLVEARIAEKASREVVVDGKVSRLPDWIRDEAVGVLFPARKKRSLRRVYGERDEESYARLFFVWSYHTLIGELDDLIVRGRGRGRRDLKIFRTFLNQYEEMAPDFWRERPDRTPEHLFAAYYQIRRAFYHIYSCIIGESAPVTELRRRVWESIFSADMMRYQRALTHRIREWNTLITGPSGTGKELVARAVGLSGFIPFDRETGFEGEGKQAFYPVNLSALSTTLIESELFGHRRGAFTGAVEDRRGYFEEAGLYGSVFLDEIGEADPAIQVKLLRVLQSREFQRLGDTAAHPFAAKVIAATNRDLEAAMREGDFREDLYFRLCGDRIETPALADILRDRPDDLRLMVGFVARKLLGEEEAEAFTESACAQLDQALPEHHPWSGNFRELERILSHYLIHGELRIGGPGPGGGWRGELEKFPLLPLREVSAAYAEAVWRRTGGYAQCARVLQVDQRTVRKMIL